MKKLFAVICLFFASACAYQNPLADFRFQTVPAPPYVLTAWHKIDAAGEPLKVYIEGEIESGAEPFLRAAAGKDPSPNVAYLGLPCQFLQAGGCDREALFFAPDAVLGMEQAVSVLMKKAQAREVILIGYDVGAQIAGQIAVRQPARVRKIITVAGVLDTRAWQEWNHLPEQPNAPSLKDSWEEFAAIPQTHFVGGRDDSVPPGLMRFIGVPEDALVVLPKATHTKGYGAAYKRIYQER